MTTKAILALLTVVLIASPADAKLFGRRNRSNSGGGYQSFPANTPPANCPDGQCRIQIAPQVAVSVAPAIATPVEVSVVVEPTIEAMQADLERLKAQVAKAEASIARMKVLAERKAAKERILQQAESQVKWLSIEHDIEDLKAQQAPLGGD